MSRTAVTAFAKAERRTPIARPIVRTNRPARTEIRTDTEIQLPRPAPNLDEIATTATIRFTPALLNAATEPTTTVTALMTRTVGRREAQEQVALRLRELRLLPRTIRADARVARGRGQHHELSPSCGCWRL